jgi:hypothetical protein
MLAKSALYTAIAIAAAAAAPHAGAVTCYVVFDRNENITYRDVFPPVDLSDAGRAEREAMRRRGEFLLFLEAEQCPRIEYFTGTAGNVGVQLEQTLAPTTPPREAAPSERSAEPPRAPRKPAPRAKQ